jgi:hypothetical protein
VTRPGTGKARAAGSGDGHQRSAGGGRRDDLPRRLGDVIVPALDKLAGGDEARAYTAWARAVGDPVTAGTRPKAFRRGQLTVECASSVWANELTYLGPQILRRMDEVTPGHPVKRFRFVVGRLRAPAAGDEVVAEGRAAAPEGSAARPPEQGSPGSAEKEERRREQPAHGSDDAARAQVEGVDDGRLRAAIEAALRRSSKEPPAAPGGSPSSG